MRKIIEVLRTDYQCIDFVIDIPDTITIGNVVYNIPLLPEGITLTETL